MRPYRFARFISVLMLVTVTDMCSIPEIYAKEKPSTRDGKREPSTIRKRPKRPRTSQSVRRTFQELHPCPSTASQSGSCPGYIAVHLVPLSDGGSDTVENLAWRTA